MRRNTKTTQSIERRRIRVPADATHAKIDGPLTIPQIAKLMGVSKQRIEQIEKRARRKILAQIEAMKLTKALQEAA